MLLRAEKTRVLWKSPLSGPRLWKSGPFRAALRTVNDRGLQPAGGCVWAHLLVDRLQFFPRLKPHGPSWRNGHFSSGARVAPDSRLARAHVEDSKSPQLN